MSIPVRFVSCLARFGATRHNSVKLYASTGVSTRTGSNFDTVGIAWQYRWGGGF
jgi:hypothetical protein